MRNTNNHNTIERTVNSTSTYQGELGSVNRSSIEVRSVAESTMNWRFWINRKKLLFILNYQNYLFTFLALITQIILIKEQVLKKCSLYKTNCFFNSGSFNGHQAVVFYLLPYFLRIGSVFYTTIFNLFKHTNKENWRQYSTSLSSCSNVCSLISDNI